MLSLTDPRGRALALLFIATALLPFQWWPPMPAGNMQLSDALILAAFIQFLLLRPALPEIDSLVLLVMFVAGVLLSALFHGGYVKLIGHLELVALYWMACSCEATGPRDLRRAIVAATFLAAIAAIAGLVFFYAGIRTPLLNHYGELIAGDYPRLRGVMFHANLLAPLLATGLLLLWFEPDLVKTRGVRRLVLALSAVALIFTFSRTIAAFLIVFAGAELLRQRRGYMAWLAWCALAATMVAALFLSVRYQVILDPTRWWEAGIGEGAGNRWTIWQDTIATIRHSPLFGIGPGHPVAHGWWAHNTWLNLWAGVGVLPFAAFAALFVSAIWQAIRVPLTGVACALAVALIDSFSLDIEDVRQLWLLMGLTAGVFHSMRSEQRN